MIPSERIEQIKELLYQQKSVSIQELCDKLFCSPSTIRRDLIDLEDAGILRRTHGGAVLVSKNTTEFSSYIRSLENTKEKHYISKIATNYIKDDMSIFMDSSSTVHALCNHLYKFKNLIIITNSILIPYTLINHDDLTVFCTGGVQKRHSYSLIGDMSFEFIKNYKPDLCFVSCKAVDETGIYEADFQQTTIKKKMIQNATKSILLVDSSKFKDSAFMSISDLTNIDTIITDKRPDTYPNFTPQLQKKFKW